MNEADLLQILARGEDSRHQFKRDETNADSIAAELTAFANSGGGLLLLGAVMALRLPRIMQCGAETESGGEPGTRAQTGTGAEPETGAATGTAGEAESVPGAVEAAAEPPAPEPGVAGLPSPRGSEQPPTSRQPQLPEKPRVSA